MPPKKYNFEHILKEEIKTLFLEQESQRSGRNPSRPPDDPSTEEDEEKEFEKGLTVNFISEDDYRYGGHAKPTDLIPISYHDLVAIEKPAGRAQITDVNWTDRQEWSYGERCAAGIDKRARGRDRSRCPHLSSQWYRYQKKRIDQIRRSLIYYRSECSRSIQLHRRSERYDKRGLLACKMVIRLEYELEEREQYIEKERKLWFRTGASAHPSSAQGRAASEAAMFTRWKKMVHETSSGNDDAAQGKIWNLAASPTSERRKEVANFNKQANCPPKRKRTTKLEKKIASMTKNAKEEARIRLQYAYECQNRGKSYGGSCEDSNHPDQWYANIKLYWELRSGGFIKSHDTKGEPGGSEWDSYKPHKLDWQDKEKADRHIKWKRLDPAERPLSHTHLNTIKGISKLSCRSAKHKEDMNPYIPGRQVWGEEYAGEHGTADGREGGGSIQANPRLLTKLKELFKSTTKWKNLAKGYRKVYGWKPNTHGNASGTVFADRGKWDYRYDTGTPKQALKRSYDVGDSLAFTRAYWTKYIIPPPSMIVCFFMTLLNKDAMFNRGASKQDRIIHATMRNLFRNLRIDMEQHGKLTGFLDSCTELCRDVADSTGPCKKIIVGLDTSALSCEQRGSNAAYWENNKKWNQDTNLCAPDACKGPKWYEMGFGDNTMRARVRVNVDRCIEARNKSIAKNGPCEPRVGKEGAVHGCAATDTAFECMNKRCKRLSKHGKVGSTYYDLNKSLKAFRRFCGPELFSKPVAVNGFGIPWDFEAAETQPYREQTKENCEDIYKCFGTNCWKTYIKEYQEYLRGKHECEETTCSKRAFANLGDARRQNCINSCMEPSKELFKPGGALHSKRLDDLIKQMKEECKDEQKSGTNNVYNPFNSGTLNLGRAFVLPQKCIPTGEHHNKPSGYKAASQWFYDWFLQPEDIAIEATAAAAVSRGILARTFGGVMIALFAMCDNPPCRGGPEYMEAEEAAEKAAAEEKTQKQRERDRLKLLAIPVSDDDIEASVKASKLLPGIEQRKEEEEEE